MLNVSWISESPEISNTMSASGSSDKAADAPMAYAAVATTMINVGGREVPQIALDAQSMASAPSIATSGMSNWMMLGSPRGSDHMVKIPTRKGQGGDVKVAGSSTRVGSRSRPTTPRADQTSKTQRLKFQLKVREEQVAELSKRSELQVQQVQHVLERQRTDAKEIEK